MHIKEELKAVRAEARKLEAQGKVEEVREFLQKINKEFSDRYEEELMNPKEALSLGSISQIIMPRSRKVLVENLNFFLRHYTPAPLQEPQTEFH